MTKTFFTASLIGSLVALLFLLPGQIEAQTMEQHQSFESGFSSRCEGDCHVTHSFLVSQTQIIHPDTRSFAAPEPRYGSPRRGWQAAQSEGKVIVAWDYRGGTCTVRYSESNIRWYKYSTTAACDNGQVTIGGLQPGASYRFQVKKDDGGWSSARWLVAR